MSQSCTLRS